MLHFGATCLENLEAGSTCSQQFNSISYRKVYWEYWEVLFVNYNKMKSK
jgi:hypothetical protein